MQAGNLLVLTGQFLLRHGPALAGIWLIGDIAQSVIRWLAVIVGQHNRMAGIAVLTLAILARVVTVVAMFRVIERATPAPHRAVPEGAPLRTPITHDVAMVLVPFFVYFAAWGLMGDLMRSYGLLSLALDPLAHHGALLVIQPGQAALVWAGGSWLLRRLAKAMQSRQPRAALWPFLVVLSETMWIFVGIYLIAAWKDEVLAFLSAIPAPSRWPGLIGAAFAQGVGAPGQLPVPADRVPPGVPEQVRAAAMSAVLPLVWFNLGAIIRGTDVAIPDPLLRGRAARAAARWEALPRAIRDFAGHFIEGTVKRWRAIAGAIRTMLSASLTLLVAVVIGFRLLDWLSAWGIVGTMRLVGPLPYAPARLAELGLDLVWGTPRSPGNGLLPEVAKTCLISAALVLVRRQRA